MAATREELEGRLGAVEQELAQLRARMEQKAAESAAGQRPARAPADPALIDALWRKALEEMGIRGEPVGPERLQAMMLAEGIKPEDNSFSREIIAMREE
jgi:hypothetical protein